jgi:hypothetical protein
VKKTLTGFGILLGLREGAKGYGETNEKRKKSHSPLIQNKATASVALRYNIYCQLHCLYFVSFILHFLLIFMPF